jgi:hypothetical protein
VGGQSLKHEDFEYQGAKAEASLRCCLRNQLSGHDSATDYIAVIQYVLKTVHLVSCLCYKKVSYLNDTQIYTHTVRGEMRNVYKIWVGNLNGADHSVDISVHWRIPLKLI